MNKTRLQLNYTIRISKDEAGHDRFTSNDIHDLILSSQVQIVPNKSGIYFLERISDKKIIAQIEHAQITAPQDTVPETVPGNSSQGALY